MQALPIALAAGGSILKGVAGLKAGQQNKKALDAQALEEERTGNAQALRIRAEARRAMGDQIGGQFSNGFQGGSGSAIDALSESQINATMDALEVRRQSASKASAARAEGKMRLSQGKFALAEGIIGAGAKVADWADARSKS